MKKRNPLAVVLLSLITFGIYDLYWLVKTKKVLNHSTSRHVPTIWLLIAPAILMIVAFVILVVTASPQTTNVSTTYNFNSVNTVSQSSQSSLSLPAFLVILLGFFAVFIISAVWFFKFSKAIDEYTKGKMSTAVSFVILWLVHLIGVALIQDVFNEMEGESMPTTNPVPAPVGIAPAPPQYQSAAVSPPPTTVQPTSSIPTQPEQPSLATPPQSMQPPANISSPM